MHNFEVKLMQYVRKTKYADENYSKDEVYYFFFKDF